MANFIYYFFHVLLRDAASSSNGLTSSDRIKATPKLSLRKTRRRMGGELWLHALLISALDGGQTGKSQPDNFTQSKKLRYMLHGKLNGAPIRF